MRPSHRSNLSAEALARLLRTHFDTVKLAGEEVRATYGAISQLSVRANGRDLRVNVSMNPKVPEDVARETIARYNRFLEEATGYSAKERAKRLRKTAGESPSGA